MTHRFNLRFALSVAIALFALPSWAQAPRVAGPVDATQVLQAIERGVAYLKRKQGPRGNWSEMPSYHGGVSALCTLALLNAGVPADDPTLVKAVDYLRGENLHQTYTVALQTMVYCAAEPKRDFLEIQKNVRKLEEMQVRAGENAGSWYYDAKHSNNGDNSNSQFAVLALYEAQRVGAKINSKTWQRALDYWRNTQNEDGSWGYGPGGAGSGSMTCAGIGGLVTCSAAIAEGDAQVENGRIVCCNPGERDDALEKALGWLGRNFSVRHNPRSPNSGSQPCLYYYLYGLERAGRLTARRFIGGHDWYREGAEFLVQEQDPHLRNWSGTWASEKNPAISTSMALLFLAKGRRPVVMAKLKYGDDDRWNQHRNDIANLVAYTEQKWELDLTWQVYDPASATVDDLLQAPVLYLSGSQLPDLIPFAQKIRDYVDRGGFLFAEACCGDGTQFDKGFREGFQKLMAAVFPEPEYRLHPLTPGHPIWRMEELVRGDSPYLGHLWGVEYGCRTCVVYSEKDVSCYWELARVGKRKRYPELVDERIADGITIGINVLTYATGREPKGKEQGFETPQADDTADLTSSRAAIEIVKLRHGGGCDDAPGALANLLRAAAQGDLKLRIRNNARFIRIDDKSLVRHHLAFMHGRHDFRLTPSERKSLATYLERGGTLFADSICASKSFATAFRLELKKTLPNYSLEAIPADDPLFTQEFGGYDIRRVTLRKPNVGAAGDPVAARLIQTNPQLEGIKIGERWAVIFSPFDISCALEQHESVQCRGYTREDAARLALNVLMYSLNL